MPQPPSFVADFDAISSLQVKGFRLLVYTKMCSRNGFPTKIPWEAEAEVGHRRLRPKPNRRLARPVFSFQR